MNRRLSYIFRILLISFLAGQFSVPEVHATDDSSDQIVWLTNANIRSMAPSGNFLGAIGIHQGKIVEVIDFSDDPSAQSRIAENKKVIDLSGKTLTPGLIDVRGSLWLEDSAINASSSNGALDIVTGIDLYQDQWREVARQGVTAVGIGPRGSLGGNSAAVSVCDGGDFDSIVLNRSVAVTAEIGLSANSSTARFQEFNRLKEAIKKAAAGEATDEKEEEDKEEEGSEDDESEESTPPQRRGRAAQAQQQAPAGRVSPPSRTEELLKQVVEGELPLHVRARHSDVILRLTELADEFKIRLVLEQILEADRWSDKIQQLQIPVVVGPFHPLSQTQSSLDKKESFDWIVNYAANGGLVAVSTFSSQPRGSRLLRLNLAGFVSKGLESEVALKTVTINAARILGIADQVGSIEVGKRADLAVFSGEPLDPSIPVTMVFGNGEVLFQATFDSTIAESVSPSDAPSSAGLKAWPTQLPAKYAIRSKRIWHESKFFDGVVSIDEGVIQSIAAADTLGADIPVFDALDRVVTPGLVAAHSHLGHQSVLGGYDESDATLIRSIDAFDSQLKLVKSMRDGGFLHVGFAPLTDRTSSGSIGQIDLSGEIPTIENPHIASQFVLSAAARDTSRHPASLDGQTKLVGNLLKQQLPESRVYVSTAIARLLEQEKLACLERVINGQAKALFVVGNEIELNAALNLIEQLNLKGAMLSSSFEVDHLQRLSELGFGVIVSSANGNEYDRHFENLATMINAGVPLGFAGETPEEIRATAAMLSSYGASSQALLTGLTQAGGSLVGMDENTAVFQPMAAADLVVWDRSPLDASAKPVAIIVDGQIQSH